MIGARRPAGVVADVLVVAEEEQLVVLDRSAERESALQVVARRRRVREVVPARSSSRCCRTRRRSPSDVFVPDLSVTLVIAPPARPNSASYALVLMLTVSIASADGISVVSSPVRWLSSMPFDLDVVRQPRLAVDVAREAVLRVEEIGVRPLQPQRAGHRDQHALEVAVEAERHFLRDGGSR